MPDQQPSPCSTDAISDKGSKEVLGQYTSPSDPENSFPFLPQAEKNFVPSIQKRETMPQSPYDHLQQKFLLQILLQEPFYPSCSFS